MAIKIAILLYLAVVLYTADAGRPNQHFKLRDSVFDGIADPPVRRLKNKRVEPQWHIHNRNGALKMGADSQISQRHIVTALRELLRLRVTGDSREILILSGNHGNELGTNWIDVKNVLQPSSKARSVRAPWSHDPDFWVDDVQRFVGRIGDEFQPIRSRIRIVDISEMTLSAFREILYSDKHVILGFCFGWNDRAFRYYLGLQPVTSIYNPAPL